MNYYKVIILTFTVTALWDVCLRFMALNHEKLPKIVNKKMPFIKDLKPYFQKHTLLSAALIAGFTGALYTNHIKSNTISKSIKNILFIFIYIMTFVIGALYGFVMKFGKLHPRLEEHYYDKLGVIRSMYRDGISGLIVQCSLLF